MRDTIEYYFWINSDWAYFGNPRLLAMAENYGLKIEYYPIDFTTVFDSTGGLKLPLRAKERRDYRLLEMKRFREILDMPINLEPKYPAKTAQLPSFFVIAAKQLGLPLYDLVHQIMIARWVLDKDIEDMATLVEISDGLGFPTTDIVALSTSEEVNTRYFEYTAEAIGKGVFGAPFYFFDSEGFWGQDRLDLLERKISSTFAA
jgi:2-hydroxychromene-2-carboxylate isomerase